MKNAIILLLLFVSGSALAIGRYQPGDTLYVWAASGLILRAGPTTSSAKLITVPYGTALIAQNDSGEHDTDIEAAPEFENSTGTYQPVILSGDFAKVLFGGNTGYLFDGYLSHNPSFKNASNNPSKQPEYEDSFDWASRTFGLLQHIKTVLDGEDGRYHEKWIFENGVLFDSQPGGQTANFRYIFHDLSMEEAFLIFNAMSNYFWHLKKDSDYTSVHNFNKHNDFEWEFEVDNCGYLVQYLPKEGLAIISQECSC